MKRHYRLRNFSSRKQFHETKSSVCQASLKGGKMEPKWLLEKILISAKRITGYLKKKKKLLSGPNSGGGLHDEVSMCPEMGSVRLMES